MSMVPSGSKSYQSGEAFSKLVSMNSNLPGAETDPATELIGLAGTEIGETGTWVAGVCRTGSAAPVVMRAKDAVQHRPHRNKTGFIGDSVQQPVQLVTQVLN